MVNGSRMSRELRYTEPIRVFEHLCASLDPLCHSDYISKHSVQQTNPQNCQSSRLFSSILTHSFPPPSVLSSITNHKECMDALCFVGCQGNLIVI